MLFGRAMPGGELADHEIGHERQAKSRDNLMHILHSDLRRSDYLTINALGGLKIVGLNFLTLMTEVWG